MMMMSTTTTAGMEESGAGARPLANLDHPPNSRLFLVISKSTPEEVIRDKFSYYGEVQDIWVVRDKQTKDHKGIAYVKFAKSSQACKAMEEMHGKALTEDTKPIKVFIAQSRGSGSHRDVEDEELTRIFVMIPKSYSEDDLRENFKEFGDIEYCSVIKNKTTGESKGFGYVRFLKPSQAAQAIENCERTFKAILAEPRNKQNIFSENEYMNAPRQDATVYGTGYEPSRVQNTSPFGEFGSFGMSEVRGGENISTCLSVTTRGVLTHEQVYSIFDLIPGLECCEIQRDPYMGYSKGYALIRYNNVASAVYAREKLNGFEYPPGNRLGVSYVEDESGDRRSNPVGMMALQLVAAQMMSMVCGGPTGQQMMPPPAYGGSTSTTQISRLQVDFSVPPCQQFAPVESAVRERLFVVFNPAVLPLDILEDLFCRYGNLIDVYLVPGRNIGYVKFAERANAAEAMEALHGKVVNGVKLKVMLADPPREESHKRQRTH
ncbi:RNA-binding protein 45 isoform X2 [Callorhinchus milii]|uniref:RNA-binding protein 45 isoform X2 n=1 Tax=Callorhinchus milii TaxID=7868 RepID=UPI00045740BA|nr:RNA-binding protein 45 isoform X2 [Callorhinchus milii]|eukprot:gi/632945837/ref/XP_007888260.1/ PREDICTED: RNA-binding protein 45 isoform X2 [Callorhinchus milii]